jgi:hypothetical protein
LSRCENNRGIIYRRWRALSMVCKAEGERFFPTEWVDELFLLPRQVPTVPDAPP